MEICAALTFLTLYGQARDVESFRTEQSDFMA